jgi:hypothetical protein
MGRNPIVAVIMMCIPIVNLYLLYKWWGELNAATKSNYNPILYTILMLIPLVNIYALWKLMTATEEAAMAKKLPGYPMGATVFLVVSFLTCFIFIGFFLMLFLIYKTQDMMNAIGA